MKSIGRYVCIILIGLLSVPIFAHAQKVQISGSINLNSEYIIAVSELLNKQQGEEYPLAENGTFKFELEVTKPTWVEVSFSPIKRDKQLGATFPMYLKPGEKYKLALNYSKEKYLEVLDNSSKTENNALLSYAGFSNGMMRDLFHKRGSLEEYRKAIDTYLSEADVLAKKYKVKQKAILDYLKLWSYNNYLAVATSNSKVIVPSTILDQIPTVFDTELTLSFYNGPLTINNYVNKQLEREMNPMKALENKYGKLNGMFSTKALVDAVIEGDLQRYVTSYRLTDKQQFAEDVVSMEKFVNSVSDKQRFFATLQDFKNLHNTSIGSVVPSVKFKDVEGKEVSLEQFKGKYIYIDLWASWCVPCIKEIPYLQELEKTFEDKNIVFVSISLDADKTAWRNKVDELKLHGHQWELGDSNYDKLMNVTGIPHFILYGPDGKLLRYKAPRPSATETKDLFKSFE